MGEFMTLREAGLPYPDMTILNTVAGRLGGHQASPVAVYGGYLRDHVLLGHTRETGDLDLAMSIASFLALKPPDGLPDYRRHFALHEPHLPFMLHQIKNGVFEANDRPLVLKLKPEHQWEWGVEIPLGLTLTREVLEPVTFAADTDLAFCEIASDGQEIWVSEDFVRERRDRTITVKRCRDALDYERTMRRIERFLSGRYQGWRLVMPEEFRAFSTSPE